MTTTTYQQHTIFPLTANLITPPVQRLHFEASPIKIGYGATPMQPTQSHVQHYLTFTAWAHGEKQINRVEHF